MGLRRPGTCVRVLTYYSGTNTARDGADAEALDCSDSASVEFTSPSLILQALTRQPISLQVCAFPPPIAH
jgi:hypothetical protein